MTAPPGTARLTSNTARPADKGAERRVISAIVTLSAASGQPLRRSDVRQMIRARLDDGQNLAEIEGYLRGTFRVDPTGVTAVRNVERERGY